MSRSKVTQGKKRFSLLAAVALFLALSGSISTGSAWAQASPQQTGPGIGEHSTPINTVPEKKAEEQDSNEAYRHSASVQKMGHMIGLNTEQAATAFEVLNFIVLAIGIGFLAVKTLPKAFRDRSTSIQKNLVDARTATEEASARLNAVEDRLSKLDAEIAGMRAQVEAETARDDERMRVAIEDEKAKILAAADSEIQAATASARRELQRHAAELAIEHAARRLVVTAETDRLLIQGFAQQLMGEKGGQN